MAVKLHRSGKRRGKHARVGPDDIAQSLRIARGKRCIDILTYLGQFLSRSREVSRCILKLLLRRPKFLRHRIGRARQVGFGGIKQPRNRRERSARIGDRGSQLGQLRLQAGIVIRLHAAEAFLRLCGKGFNLFPLCLRVRASRLYRIRGGIQRVPELLLQRNRSVQTCNERINERMVLLGKVSL